MNRVLTTVEISLQSGSDNRGDGSPIRVEGIDSLDVFVVHFTGGGEPGRIPGQDQLAEILPSFGVGENFLADTFPFDQTADYGRGQEAVRPGPDPHRDVRGGALLMPGETSDAVRPRRGRPTRLPLPELRKGHGPSSIARRERSVTSLSRNQIANSE